MTPFVKYCILSEVCMIKTTPHRTVSPQMWCMKSIIGWFTRPQICWQDFVKLKLSNAKNSAWFVSKNLFSPGLIYCYQEPLCLFNVIEEDCYFLGVHIRLSTRCKIWFTLRLSVNYFSLKPLSLSLKWHECALKLTDLRNTSLLFDLNYKIYSWELRF